MMIAGDCKLGTNSIGEGSLLALIDIGVKKTMNETDKKEQNMPVWRPSQDLRVKALGLHWRGDNLLAAEVEDDQGNIKGVRPLGGSLEFGETWQQALKREFMEELGVEASITGPPIVLENIYEHHGAKGHEILFIADVIFPTGAFEGQEMINFSEDSGIICTAGWFDINRLDGDGPTLFPEGLKDVLLKKFEG